MEFSGKAKFRACKMAKFAVFEPLKLQNLSGSKIHKFPHCVEETKVLTYLEYHEMSLTILLILRLKRL